MYEQFYKFSVDPFRLSPDHRFSFGHPTYAKAKAYIQYALNRAEGFVMVTGKPGTGKTTLVNDVLHGLPRTEMAVATLVSTQLEADDLLRMVAYSFGLDGGVPHKALVLQRVTEFLNRQQGQGRRALLIIDEAQDLSVRALEELRLLTNLQGAGRPLLQIVLLGQEGLRELVRRPEMEQVQQRLVAACDLEPLGIIDGLSYVLHRLKRAGWRGNPAIERKVWPILYEASEGVPRRINLVCSRLLLHGCVEERHTLTEEDAAVVVAELQREELAPAESGAVLDALPAVRRSSGEGRDEFPAQANEEIPGQTIEDPRIIVNELLSAYFDEKIPQRPKAPSDTVRSKGEPQAALEAEPVVTCELQGPAASGQRFRSYPDSSPDGQRPVEIRPVPRDNPDSRAGVPKNDVYTSNKNVPLASGQRASGRVYSDRVLDGQAADDWGVRTWPWVASIAFGLIILGGAVLYFRPAVLEQQLVWLERRMDSIRQTARSLLDQKTGLYDTRTPGNLDEQPGRQADAKRSETDSVQHAARFVFDRSADVDDNGDRGDLDERPSGRADAALAGANRSEKDSVQYTARSRIDQTIDVDEAQDRGNLNEQQSRQADAVFDGTSWSKNNLATVGHYGYHRIEYDAPSDASTAPEE